VLRITLTILIVCGLLDATAVLNVSSFGIGAYVAADVFALGVLAFHARAVGWSQIVMNRDTMILALVLVALIWLFATLQTWFEMTDTWRVLTQSTLRTLLVVHFLICTAFIEMVDDKKFLVKVVALSLSFYLLYGMYDFLAQIVGYPRFLNGLRNSQSFNINQGIGGQGWIALLPRLSSLAAEPSHTAMQVLLGFYLASTFVSRWRRSGLMILTLAFCVGTFARTIWIAVAGAIVGVMISFLLMRGGKDLKKTAAMLVVAIAILLPMAVLTFPLFTWLPAGADLSIAERFDSSKAGLLFFAQHPLLGVGLHGWDNHPIHDVVDRISAAPGDLREVFNGVAAYLAALGVAGLFVVYAPLVLLLRSNLEVVEKTWWVCAYSLTLLGGDYLALVSTWTTIAIVTASIKSSPRALRYQLLEPAINRSFN
jgi:hypothetical protein